MRCWEQVSWSRHPYLGPLCLYPSGDLFDTEGPTSAPGGRRPHLAPAFIADFSERLGMEWVPDGTGDRVQSFGPEDVFHYIYAVFHSPMYRERYAEFLKIDFPRLPLTTDAELFRGLCASGEELAGLHLMERHRPLVTKFPVAGDNTVEKVRYTEPGQGVDEGACGSTRSSTLMAFRPRCERSTSAAIGWRKSGSRTARAGNSASTICSTISA